MVNKIKEFATNARLRNFNIKREKENVQNSALVLLKGRQMVVNNLKSEIFQCLRKNQKENQMIYLH